ncbi:MAG: hypothetical protein EXQ69_03810 [Acidimicrobiia bacterium]|nr:hypothetical protein [Acidimicrobiia bacterium]
MLESYEYEVAPVTAVHVTVMWFDAGPPTIELTVGASRALAGLIGKKIAATQTATTTANAFDLWVIARNVPHLAR